MYGVKKSVIVNGCLQTLKSAVYNKGGGVDFFKRYIYCRSIWRFSPSGDKMLNFFIQKDSLTLYKYLSTKETIQGCDVQYFLHRQIKSTKIVLFRFIWAKQIRLYQQHFSTSLSEQIMDRQKLSCSMEVCGVQWHVWPPLAATKASHSRRIEPINRWIKDCGMLFHSCTSVSGGFWRWRTRLPSSSHRWPIGSRSCDNGGQGRPRMWFGFRKPCQPRATWHLALSCWKTWSKFRSREKGRTLGSNISFLYFYVP
jgi:hypothetical protein